MVQQEEGSKLNPLSRQSRVKVFLEVSKRLLNDLTTSKDGDCVGYGFVFECQQFRQKLMVENLNTRFDVAAQNKLYKFTLFRIEILVNTVYLCPHHRL